MNIHDDGTAIGLSDKVRGELLSAGCPSRDVLKHVTSQWGVLVLIVLEGGTHRFSELRRKIGGVSERMLAQALQLLEADGFVLRRAYPVVPPHVEYSLTPLAKRSRRRYGFWPIGSKSTSIAFLQAEGMLNRRDSLRWQRTELCCFDE